MIEKIDIVIGSAYGDEGKGATTNALSTPESVVVRFNGGAQAGHTVEHEGIRHVFSHFGAGTLKGAKTYLSKYFVCNPFIFTKELIELDKMGLVPQVYVDPQAYVTTPFDMTINRMLERKRGKDRHGSVGVGFGETIERSERYRPVIYAGDMLKRDVYNRSVLQRKLKEIANEWYPQRCKELNIECEEIELTELSHFIKDCELFGREAKLACDWPALGKHFVFEGAQGLMLDEDYGDFPHVTRSHCGLKNAMAMIGDSEPLNIHYVTRTYTTRHGAGPFAHELDDKPYPDIVDNTNVFNKHQEGLRFSYLNLDTIFPAIKHDLDTYHTCDCPITLNLKVTCIDQLPEEGCKLIHNGEVKEFSRAEFMVYVRRQFWERWPLTPYKEMETV